MPETEAAKRRAILGDLQAEFERTLSTAKSATDSRLLVASVERSMAPYSQFREAWTQKQDSLDREYFELWRRWSNPIVQMEKDDFPFQYPTAGAAKGSALDRRVRRPRIHATSNRRSICFAANMKVLTHTPMHRRSAP